VTDLLLQVLPLLQQFLIVSGIFPSLADILLHLFLLGLFPRDLLALSFELLPDDLLVDGVEVFLQVIFDEDECNDEVVPGVVLNSLVIEQSPKAFGQEVVLHQFVVRFAVVLVSDSSIFHNVCRIFIDRHFFGDYHHLLRVSALDLLSFFILPSFPYLFAL
jgi:hypothetical protein